MLRRFAVLVFILLAPALFAQTYTSFPRRADVARLQVAMQNPLPVRLFQPVRNFNRNAQQLRRRQRPSLESLTRVSPSRNSITKKSIPS